MDTASPAREREAALIAQCVTHDVDAEFGARILLPADLVVISEDGALVHFDPSFNPMFALLHEDYRQDAIPVDLAGYIGNPADIRQRIDAAVELASGLRP